MVWCSYCAKDQETENDDINGFTCCTGCGRVLDDSVFSSDPTFSKTADGQSQVQGNFIKDAQYSNGRSDGSGFRFCTDSHEKTLEKGRNEIKDIADFLAMGGRDDAVGAAHRLYILAVERNFTRGRRTNQVAAACLYIVCRQDQKPFLLIDFSDCLQTNVYVLGAVFLQLCRLLRLEQHPIMQKPVDPSLFIHRFTDRLVGRTMGHGKKFHSISNTALRLVASMKRDWIQTGRRPSGICGAALFLSAHIHGFDCTKADVVSVVHVCEATLKKRLIEFENTESGSLTAEEFEARAKELEAQEASITEAHVINSQSESEKRRDVLCEHKDVGAANFAFGLCISCYEEFIKISGGLQGGAAPPAFQRAEKQRMEASKTQTPKQGLSTNLKADKILRSKCNGSGKPGREDGYKAGRGRGRGRGRRSRSHDQREAQELRNELLAWGTGRGKRKARKRRKLFDAFNFEPQNEDVKVDKGRSMPDYTDKIAEQFSLSQQQQKVENDGIFLPAIQQQVEKDISSSGFILEKHSTILNEKGDCVAKCKEFGEVGESGIFDSFILESPKEDQKGDDIVIDLMHKMSHQSFNSFVDEETLSDIDDKEVELYLHTEEEVRLKTIIWTEMNKDYLEEQQAKEEALAASQAAQAAALAAAASNSASAVELAAAAAAAVAELKKDKRRKKLEAKNKPPAESAAEATRQMLQSKRLSSKVNYTALEKLFEGENGTKTEIGDDVKPDSKKHVKWADEKDTTPSVEKQNDPELSFKSENAATKDDEMLEDDDLINNDAIMGSEDEQNQGYPLSYEQDYGDDEYYDY